VSYLVWKASAFALLSDQNRKLPFAGVFQFDHPALAHIPQCRADALLDRLDQLLVGEVEFAILHQAPVDRQAVHRGLRLPQHVEDTRVTCPLKA
jgi:hypothetical protein